MANTTFVDGVTLTNANWFNDVNDAIYEVLGDNTTAPTTAIAAMKNLMKKGADIASSGTTNLAAATGNFVHITGTTTITAFGTVNAGVVFWLVFDGALTLTHNGTSLILPGAANIKTAANDILMVVSEGSGNWRCVDYIRAVSTSFIPSGVVWDYAGSSAPAGWLPCDGAAVSRTTYANLFTAISTTWGVGDGSTTFNVPDFKGRTTIGDGAGSGLTSRTLAGSGGEETHLMTTAEMVAHTHTAPLGNGDGAGSFAQQVTAASGNNQTTSSVGSSTPFNVMQPFKVVKKIIKI